MLVKSVRSVARVISSLTGQVNLGLINDLAAKTKHPPKCASLRGMADALGIILDDKDQNVSVSRAITKWHLKC
jgi:hypothetical protein